MESEPFLFQRQGDRYLGRGTTDDKGPALTALMAARFASQQGLPVNFQFIWELEEEIGSPNFEHFVQQETGSLDLPVRAGVRHHLAVAGKAPRCPTACAAC